MKYIKLFLFILLLSFGISFQNGAAQQISANLTNQAERNNAFLIDGNTLQFQQNSAVINDKNVRNIEAFNINSQRSLLSFILNNTNKSELQLYSVNGKLINTISDLQFEDDDPSVMAYPLPDGRAIVRENIANFSIYDTYGDLTETVSNSSGSEEGESVSKLAMDPGGSNIIVYNPQINYSNSKGSRVQAIRSDGYLDNLFNSRDRTIHKLHVSESGSFILILTKKAGTDDQVLLVDRFGNELDSFEFDDDLLDAKFGMETNHIVAYSSGRVRVYNMFTGESMGSTSIRGSGTIFYADYSPRDNQILALTGSKSSNTNYVNSVEAHAVDVEKRKLDDTEVVNSYLTHPKVPLRMERRGANQFTITGGGGDINIRTNF